MIYIDLVWHTSQLIHKYIIIYYYHGFTWVYPLVTQQSTANCTYIIYWFNDLSIQHCDSP